MDIDWNHLNTLRDEVGPEDYAEVVDLFLEEVGDVISRLNTGLKLDTLEEDLHFLKSSALNLGFVSFSSMCQNGEIMARNGNSESVDLASIIQCFERSQSVFERGKQAEATVSS